MIGLKKNNCASLLTLAVIFITLFFYFKNIYLVHNCAAISQVTKLVILL